jgi:hypothetical protein
LRPGSGRRHQVIFPLANINFALQSKFMESKWAEENLQTIRTLMERSAVYRRALAPIMLFAGALGVLAAVAGLLFHLDSPRVFIGFWLGVATVAVAGAFLIARRQSLRAKEVFWSPPTRRVGQALLPPLLAGLVLGALPGFKSGPDELTMIVTLVWMLLYGCALHAAGFFMPRGIKIFGWLFIASGCLLFNVFMAGWLRADFSVHWLMGFFFGGLHLAYGAYLYLTERKNPAA